MDLRSNKKLTVLDSSSMMLQDSLTEKSRPKQTEMSLFEARHGPHFFNKVFDFNAPKTRVFNTQHFTAVPYHILGKDRNQFVVMKNWDDKDFYTPISHVAAGKMFADIPEKFTDFGESDILELRGAKELTRDAAIEIRKGGLDISYGYTPDFLFKCDTKVVIGDWKTQVRQDQPDKAIERNEEHYRVYASNVERALMSKVEIHTVVLQRDFIVSTAQVVNWESLLNLRDCMFTLYDYFKALNIDPADIVLCGVKEEYMSSLEQQSKVFNGKHNFAKLVMMWLAAEKTIGVHNCSGCNPKYTVTIPDVLMCSTWNPYSVKRVQSLPFLGVTDCLINESLTFIKDSYKKIQGRFLISPTLENFMNIVHRRLVLFSLTCPEDQHKGPERGIECYLIDSTPVEVCDGYLNNWYNTPSEWIKRAIDATNNEFSGQAVKNTIYDAKGVHDPPQGTQQLLDMDNKYVKGCKRHVRPWLRQGSEPMKEVDVSVFTELEDKENFISIPKNELIVNLYRRDGRAKVPVLFLDAIESQAMGHCCVKEDKKNIFDPFLVNNSFNDFIELFDAILDENDPNPPQGVGSFTRGVNGQDVMWDPDLERFSIGDEEIKDFSTRKICRSFNLMIDILRIISTKTKMPVGHEKLDSCLVGSGVLSQCLVLYRPLLCGNVVLSVVFLTEKVKRRQMDGNYGYTIPYIEIGKVDDDFLCKTRWFTMPRELINTLTCVFVYPVFFKVLCEYMMCEKMLRNQSTNVSRAFAILMIFLMSQSKSFNSIAEMSKFPICGAISDRLNKKDYFEKMSELFLETKDYPLTGKKGGIFGFVELGKMVEHVLTHGTLLEPIADVVWKKTKNSLVKDPALFNYPLPYMGINFRHAGQIIMFFSLTTGCNNQNVLGKYFVDFRGKRLQSETISHHEREKLGVDHISNDLKPLGSFNPALNAVILRFAYEFGKSLDSNLSPEVLHTNLSSSSSLPPIDFTEHSYLRMPGTGRRKGKIEGQTDEQVVNSNSKESLKAQGHALLGNLTSFLGTQPIKKTTHFNEVWETINMINIGKDTVIEFMMQSFKLIPLVSHLVPKNQRKESRPISIFGCVFISFVKFIENASKRACKRFKECLIDDSKKADAHLKNFVKDPLVKKNGREYIYSGSTSIMLDAEKYNVFYNSSVLSALFDGWLSNYPEVSKMVQFLFCWASVSLSISTPDWYSFIATTGSNSFEGCKCYSDALKSAFNYSSSGVFDTKMLHLFSEEFSTGSWTNLQGRRERITQIDKVIEEIERQCPPGNWLKGFIARNYNLKFFLQDIDLCKLAFGFADDDLKLDILSINADEFAEYHYLRKDVDGRVGNIGPLMIPCLLSTITSIGFPAEGVYGCTASLFQAELMRQVSSVAEKSIESLMQEDVAVSINFGESSDDSEIDIHLFMAKGPLHSQIAKDLKKGFDLNDNPTMRLQKMHKSTEFILALTEELTIYLMKCAYYSFGINFGSSKCLKTTSIREALSKFYVGFVSLVRGKQSFSSAFEIPGPNLEKNYNSALSRAFECSCETTPLIGYIMLCCSLYTIALKNGYGTPGFDVCLHLMYLSDIFPNPVSKILLKSKRTYGLDEKNELTLIASTKPSVGMKRTMILSRRAKRELSLIKLDYKTLYNYHNSLPISSQPKFGMLMYMSNIKQENFFSDMSFFPSLSAPLYNTYIVRNDEGSIRTSLLIALIIAYKHHRNQKKDPTDLLFKIKSGHDEEVRSQMKVQQEKCESFLSRTNDGFRSALIGPRGYKRVEIKFYDTMVKSHNLLAVACGFEQGSIRRACQSLNLPFLSEFSTGEENFLSFCEHCGETSTWDRIYQKFFLYQLKPSLISTMNIRHGKDNDFDSILRTMIPGRIILEERMASKDMSFSIFSNFISYMSHLPIYQTDLIEILRPISNDVLLNCSDEDQFAVQHCLSILLRDDEIVDLAGLSLKTRMFNIILKKGVVFATEAMWQYSKLNGISRNRKKPTLTVKDKIGFFLWKTEAVYNLIPFSINDGKIDYFYNEIPIDLPYSSSYHPFKIDTDSLSGFYSTNFNLNLFQFKEGPGHFMELGSLKIATRKTEMRSRNWIVTGFHILELPSEYVCPLIRDQNPSNFFNDNLVRMVLETESFKNRKVGISYGGSELDLCQRILEGDNWSDPEAIVCLNAFLDESMKGSIGYKRMCMKFLSTSVLLSSGMNPFSYEKTEHDLSNIFDDLPTLDMIKNSSLVVQDVTGDPEVGSNLFGQFWEGLNFSSSELGRKISFTASVLGLKPDDEATDDESDDDFEYDDEDLQ